jgi:hypothetical protein
MLKEPRTCRGTHPTSLNGKAYAGAESSLFCASSLYTDMTYSKAVPVRSTEGAAGLNSYAMSWFVPPLVVPALLAALLLAWIVYQAYS